MGGDGVGWAGKWWGRFRRCLFASRGGGGGGGRGGDGLFLASLIAIGACLIAGSAGASGAALRPFRRSGSARGCGLKRQWIAAPVLIHSESSGLALPLH